MKLHEYLKEKGETEEAFASRSGLQQRTVNRIRRGASCTAYRALAIIKATAAEKTLGGGCVSLEDLAIKPKLSTAAGDDVAA